MPSKHNRLLPRLQRSLKPWEPENDGPWIEVGTLVEAFNIPGSTWHGCLADTTADGQRPRKTPGIEGRTYQTWRVGVLTRGLFKWIKYFNPSQPDEYIQKVIDDLVKMHEAKMAATRARNVKGIKEAAAAKREAKEPKVKTPKAKSLQITSDALFRVWG